MSKKLFVNLPVKDLDRSVDFFSKLGFSFDPEFTDENATSMIVNDDAYVMLLRESFFSTFTTKNITDTSSSTEALFALSVDSRQEVDQMVDQALDIGGSPAREAEDQGFMYGKSFQDPDGHIWEVVYMDMEAFQQE